MISEDEQYKYIGTVITDRIDRTRDGFKLYVQLFSAIVGGSVWLSVQKDFLQLAQQAKPTYSCLSNVLVGLSSLRNVGTRVPRTTRLVGIP